MSFSKAPIRRFNDPNSPASKQKGKIQKSQSGFQKKTIHSVKNVRNNKDIPEQLTDLQPVEAESPFLPKLQEYKNEFLIELEQRFEELPGKLYQVGRDAISNRDNMVTWLSKLKKKYNMVTNDVEILERHVQEGDELKKRWEEAGKEETAFMKQVLQMCAEKLLHLEKENLQLTELNKQLETKSQEVMMLKRHKDVLEEKLKQSNERMSVLEQRLSEEEKHLRELLEQNIEIEKQLKLKEQYNDQKLQQTQKCLDTYNMKSQSHKLELEQRVNELKDDVSKKEFVIEDLKQQLKTAKDELSLRFECEKNAKVEESGKLMKAEQELNKRKEQIETLSQDLFNLKQLLRRSMYGLLVRSRQPL